MLNVISTLALLLVSSQASAQSTTTQPEPFGVMTIGVRPAWANYSSNVTVTFTFIPPCPGISLFMTTPSLLEVCALGPACPYSNVFEGTAKVFYLAGDTTRLYNVTTLTNGYYYATCPSNLRSYRTNTPPGVDNLQVGVAPQILRIQIQQGYYFGTYYNLTRIHTVNGKPDNFTYSGGEISFAEYDSINILFGVGKGYNPKTKDSSNFSFSVPAFEDYNGAFAFVRKNDELSTPMFDVIPYGLYYGYTVSKAALATAGTCFVEGTATAILGGAPFPDTVAFHIGFTYPLTVSDITVDRSTSCTCLFTCQTQACPKDKASKVEWLFFNNATNPYPSESLYVPGNMPTKPDSYLLNATACRDLYKSILSRKTQSSHVVRCRAYPTRSASPVDFSFRQPAEMLTVPVYDLLRPCTSSEFMCTRTLQCIPSALQCNGRKNCLDGSDEVNCVSGVCSVNQFQCTTSKECIPSVKRCDSVADCADQSDETNCISTATPCSKGFYYCSNRRCTRGRYVCDGENDCGDNSDERQCRPCATGEFACSNGKCISRYMICDGTNNCGDNSDEINCGTYFSTSCGLDNFQCANGRCVISSNLCDNDDDCRDGSDERGCGIGMGTTPSSLSTTSTCGEEEFRCNNGECVDDSDVCDGSYDCDDHSDEDPSRCQNCTLGRFHCKNSRCVSTSVLCDGDDDCGDNSDEAPSLCQSCLLSNNMWKCKVSKKCIHFDLLCSSTEACGRNDHSDKSPPACKIALANTIESSGCPPETVKCASSGVCVPYSALCNGINDCCPTTMTTYDYGSGGGSSFNEYDDYSYSTSTVVLPENETHIGSCERTDELGCFRSTTCQWNNGGCAGKCLDVAMVPEINLCGNSSTPTTGAYCTCNSGYMRPFNNFTKCIDVDQCQSAFSNNCSQICINKVGSYNCSCVDGFTLTAPVIKNVQLGTCDLTSDPDVVPVFVFIYGDTIRFWQKTKASIVAHTTFDKTFTAVDIDIRDGTIIYAETGNTRLYRSSIPAGDGHQPPSLPLHSAIEYATVIDLAIDFIGNNLYVADINDRLESRITVSLIDGRYQKTIQKTSNVEITSLAVNPFLGRMYYATYSSMSILSDSTVSEVTVVMAPMNGRPYSQTQIFKSDADHMIRTIAVDYLAGGRLYMHDANDGIIVMNWDGSFNQSFTMEIYTHVDRAFDVFANSLYGFFTDDEDLESEGELSLFQVDKFGRMIATNLTNGLYQISSLRAYHPFKAGLPSTWPNPCATARCSHLCLIDFGGNATCACPDGDDQQTCTSKVFAEPDHPTNCLKTCTVGQGICVKDRNEESYKCMCNRFFNGPFCTETIVEETVTVKEINTTSAAPVTPPTVLHTGNPVAEAVAASTTAKSATSVDPESKGVLIAVIVVAVVLLVLFLLAVAAVVILWRRGQANPMAGFNMHHLHDDGVMSVAASTVN